MTTATITTDHGTITAIVAEDQSGLDVAPFDNYIRLTIDGEDLLWDKAVVTIN